MTNKAYIVTNKQQEHEVLEQLEREGMVWGIINEKPTDFNPRISYLVSFPYVIFVNDWLSWNWLPYLENEEIVFDGRKEEQMSDKYVVSQEFMDKLEEWKDTLDSNDYEDKPLVGWTNIKNLPVIVYIWLGGDVPDKENNNRLIAIIRWVNGEDVFEVEKPKKWVVRSESKDSEGDYWYVRLDGNENNKASVGYDIETATRFDTKEEAQSWANSHQEVVQVEVEE